MDNAFSKMIVSFCEIGFFNTMPKIVIGIQSRIRVIKLYRHGIRFDNQFALDTQEIMSLEDQNIHPSDREHSVAYEPTPVSLVCAIPDQLPIRYEDFSFVDLGCGKGRVLLLASSFPFRQIAGIEIYSDIVEIAKINIERYRLKATSDVACSDISVCNQNATDFEFPDRDFVLYLVNPFSEVIMSQVVASLERKLDQVRSRIIVIYVNPLHAKLFDESKHFRLTKESGSDLYYLRYRIYRNH